MKFKNHDPKPVEMQLVPMIDVVLHLLIFFILTWQYTTAEKDMNVSVPSAEEGADPKRVLGEKIINVKKNGEVVVDGMVMSQAQLRQKLELVSKQHKNQPVRIRGDSECQWQGIAQVIDTCQKAGIWNISFATQLPKKEQ